MANNTNPRDARRDAEIAKQWRGQTRYGMVLASEDTAEIGDGRPVGTIRQYQIGR